MQSISDFSAIDLLPGFFGLDIYKFKSGTICSLKTIAIVSNYLVLMEQQYYQIEVNGK